MKDARRMGLTGKDTNTNQSATADGTVGSSMHSSRAADISQPWLITIILT